jgi:hypothetical protein
MVAMSRDEPAKLVGVKQDVKIKQKIVPLGTV